MLKICGITVESSDVFSPFKVDLIQMMSPQLTQTFKVLVLPAEHEFVLEYSSCTDFFFYLLSTPCMFSPSVFRFPMYSLWTGQRTGTAEYITSSPHSHKLNQNAC